VTGDLPETVGTTGSRAAGVPAVIYPPPPMSMPPSSNGNGGGGGQHRHVTDGPMYYRHHGPVMSTIAPVRPMWPVNPVMYLVIPHYHGAPSEPYSICSEIKTPKASRGNVGRGVPSTPPTKESGGAS